MYRWFVAYRYVFSRFLTLAVLLVVTLAVTVLIIVVSVMEGFRNELETRIRGTTSDIKIESSVFLGLEAPDRVRELVESVPGVAGTAAVIETFALYNVGIGTSFDREAEDRLLLAFDFDNDLSRRELDRALRAAPVKPDFPEFRGLFRPDVEELARELFASQPRSTEEIFSKQWIEGDLWKPWRSIKPNGPFPKGLPLALVGAEAFRRELLLTGATIRLTSISPVQPTPKTQEFLVAGYFKTGLYDIDAKGIILSLDDANDFLGLEATGSQARASGLRVEVEPAYQDEAKLISLRERIETVLDENEVWFVTVQTWREARAQLLTAVKVEKVIVSVILGVVILFAGFMIFIVLTVQVVEKTRDIAVLQSLGASTWGIVSLFFAIGVTLSIAGVLLGAFYGIGFGLCANTLQRWIELLTGLVIFPDDVYYLEEIPVKFEARDLIQIIVATVSIALLASLIPAIRAARRDPVKGLTGR